MRTRSNRGYSQEEVDISHLSQQSLLDDFINFVQQSSSTPRASTDTNRSVQTDETDNQDTIEEDEIEVEQFEQFTSNTPNTSTDTTPKNITTTRPRTTTTRRTRHTHSFDSVVQNVVVLSIAVGTLFFFFDIAITIGTVIIGLLRPAWLTFKALEARPRRRAKAVEELRNWQTYWIVVALLLATDWSIKTISFISLPSMIHHAITFAIIAWLTRDHAANAALVYDHSIRPMLLKYEDSIDQLGTKLLKKVDKFSNKALKEMNHTIHSNAVTRGVQNAAVEVQRAAAEIEQAAVQAEHENVRGYRGNRFRRFLR